MTESGAQGSVNKLSRLKIGMYHAALDVDRDFIANGDRPYFAVGSWLAYAEYIALLSENRRGRRLPYGWSPYEMNVLTNDSGDILCLGQLRFGDDCGNATWAGHIGYTVPPSLRGKGYAKEFLRLSLERAWELGFERALLTCDLDNHVSRHVIEVTGGVYAGKHEDFKYRKHKFWFERP